MIPTVAKKGEDGQLDNGFTKEHVKPRKLGGKGGKNIVLSHAKCNSHKGCKMPDDEMLARVKRIWHKAKKISKILNQVPRETQISYNIR